MSFRWWWRRNRVLDEKIRDAKAENARSQALLDEAREGVVRPAERIRQRNMISDIIQKALAGGYDEPEGKGSGR
jgi:hypothetical protein